MDGRAAGDAYRSHTGGCTTGRRRTQNHRGTRLYEGHTRGRSEASRHRSSAGTGQWERHTAGGDHVCRGTPLHVQDKRLRIARVSSVLWLQVSLLPRVIMLELPFHFSPQSVDTPLRRGEALHSICSNCGELTILTRTCEDELGTMSVFNTKGLMLRYARPPPRLSSRMI